MEEIDLQPKLPRTLPFPPLTKSHIMNCSYHSWYPKYRSSTPKARVIPLSTSFVSYLRADGIILPHDTPTQRLPQDWSDNDSGVFSGAENDESDDDEDPAAEWRDLHDLIGQTIESLGGSVVPKLNWSAPKDATWINPNNSLQCGSPDDVYLLLKSSDFVTHDLEHAFDDCIDDSEEESQMTINDIPYHLVLKKYFQLNPSLEFRCFVRRRKVIGICQRDLNFFEFLFKMKDQYRRTIMEFFDEKLRDTFPDENFAFDVYIPPPHDKVWLVDVNPWAARTDPLLFSWLELLTMEGFDEEDIKTDIDKETSPVNETPPEEDDEVEVEVIQMLPEFRLVGRDDPEAYNFSSTKYGAHKLPKDVVDASRDGGESLREFAVRWKDLVEGTSTQRQNDDSDDNETV
jgi:D123